MKFSTPVVHVPVSLDHGQLHTWKQLGARYEVNRSEIIRLALARGLPFVGPELKRIQRERAVGERRAEALESTPSTSVSSSVDSSEHLAAYVRTLREIEPNRSAAEVRSLLTVQAKVLGVSPAELDDVVDEVISSMPPLDGDGAHDTHVVDRSQPPD